MEARFSEVGPHSFFFFFPFLTYNTEIVMKKLASIREQLTTGLDNDLAVTFPPQQADGSASTLPLISQTYLTAVVEMSLLKRHFV